MKKKMVTKAFYVALICLQMYSFAIPAHAGEIQKLAQEPDIIVISPYNVVDDKPINN